MTHPRTGVAEELTFSDAVLASSLRFLAYSPVSQMMIPYLIHEAATTGSPDLLILLMIAAIVVGPVYGTLVYYNA